MNKGELIRSLEGLMDETEIVVGTQSLTGVWDITAAEYMKSRGDEPAYVRLAIRGASKATTEARYMSSTAHLTDAEKRAGFDGK